MTELDSNSQLFSEENRAEAIERVSVECNLPPDHVAVSRIVEIETSEQMALTALADALSDLSQTKAKLEASRQDELTGLLLRRPFAETAEALFAEIDMAIETKDFTKPNAALVVMIDIEAMHHINNRHGHEAGDKAIVSTAEIMKTTAEFMISVTRSIDRRDEPRESDSETRPKDILGRRGGDEFVMIMPFIEDPVYTRERIAELISARMNSKLGYGVEDMPYINWKHTFYEPGKSLEQLINEADPKAGKTRAEKIKRSCRKIGRAALGKY